MVNVKVLPSISTTSLRRSEHSDRIPEEFRDAFRNSLSRGERFWPEIALDGDSTASLRSCVVVMSKRNSARLRVRTTNRENTSRSLRLPNLPASRQCSAPACSRSRSLACRIRGERRAFSSIPAKTQQCTREEPKAPRSDCRLARSTLPRPTHLPTTRSAIQTPRYIQFRAGLLKLPRNPPILSTPCESRTNLPQFTTRTPSDRRSTNSNNSSNRQNQQPRSITLSTRTPRLQARRATVRIHARSEGTSL